MARKYRITVENVVRMATGKALERETRKEYESSGWEVISTGMPDLFCFKLKDNGSYQFRFIECKAGKSALSSVQKRVITRLREIGFEALVIRGSRRAGV